MVQPTTIWPYYTEINTEFATCVRHFRCHSLPHVYSTSAATVRHMCTPLLPPVCHISTPHLPPQFATCVRHFCRHSLPHVYSTSAASVRAIFRPRTAGRYGPFPWSCGGHYCSQNRRSTPDLFMSGRSETPIEPRPARSVSTRVPLMVWAKTREGGGRPQGPPPPN